MAIDIREKIPPLNALLSILVELLIVVGPLYWAFSTIQIKNQAQIKYSIRHAIQVKTEYIKEIESSAASTEDWQNYSNSLYKFSFQYPPGYKVEDNLAKEIKVKTSATENLTVSNDSLEGKPQLIVYVNAADFDLYHPDITYQASEKDGKISIARRATIYDDWGTQDKFWVILADPIQINDKIFLFIFRYGEGDKYYEPVFSRILSTVQFK